MTIEIVDLPIENGGSSHSYVTVYQRVDTWGPAFFFGASSSNRNAVAIDRCMTDGMQLTVQLARGKSWMWLITFCCSSFRSSHGLPLFVDD